MTLNLRDGCTCLSFTGSHAAFQQEINALSEDTLLVLSFFLCRTFNSLLYFSILKCVMVCSSIVFAYRRGILKPFLREASVAPPLQQIGDIAPFLTLEAGIFGYLIIDFFRNVLHKKLGAIFS